MNNINNLNATNNLNTIPSNNRIHDGKEDEEEKKALNANNHHTSLNSHRSSVPFSNHSHSDAKHEEDSKFEVINPISKLLHHIPSLLDNNFPFTAEKHRQVNDGDCLFSALITALQSAPLLSAASNSQVDFIHNLTPQTLRQLCCNIAASDQISYSPLLLGHSSLSAYKKHILNEFEWGSAIEIKMLSDYFQLDINCFDIAAKPAQANLINFTYHDRHLSNEPRLCINLLYSGTHYDNLTVLNHATQSNLYLFQSADSFVPRLLQDYSNTEAIVYQAAKQAQLANKKKIQCLECLVVLETNEEAQFHSMETDHIEFGEV
jgi:hypothetical protein